MGVRAVFNKNGRSCMKAGIEWEGWRVCYSLLTMRDSDFWCVPEFRLKGGGGTGYSLYSGESK